MHARTALFLATTLGIWLGIHSLRAYLALSVWNLADALPLQFKSLLPTGIFAVALFAHPAARLVGRDRAFQVFGVSFAAAYALRQWLGNADVLGSIVAFASFILFMWWLPTLFERAALSGQRLIVAPAAALAISLLVGGQTLLHGLDVPLLRGGGGYIIATVLAAVLGYAVMRSATVDSTEAEPISRGIVAFMAFWLFLELMLFANPGAVQQITGMTLVPAALLIQFGLALGILISSTNTPVARLVAAVVLLFSCIFADAPGFVGVLLLALGHAAAYVLLAGAFSRGTKARRVFTHGALLLSGAAFFVFLFGYYARYEAHGVLPFLAVGLGLLGLGRGVELPRAQRTVALVVAAVAVVSALGALIPAPGVPRGEPTQLTVMSYNIHQGYDVASLPGMPYIAETIAEQRPDVVALQEVGRGWNLLGGADLVAYLRWRFKDHEVLFVPTNGRLWGNAIMSREPIGNVQPVIFAANESFRYGMLQAETAGLTIASVHLSADLNEKVDGIRARQAEELMNKLVGPRTLIVGDFNAQPGTPAINALTRRFVDLAFFFGLGAVPTWSNQRLDYIFATQDLQAVGVRVGVSHASDHKPVIVVLKR